MRIAWIHSHLLMGTGGTKFIYEVTRRLAQRAELTLFCEQASESIRGRFEAGGVRVEAIGTATSTSAMYWLNLRSHLRRETEDTPHPLGSVRMPSAQSNFLSVSC